MPENEPCNIVEKAKENWEKLKPCKLHSFIPTITKDGPLDPVFPDYICEHCKGVVNKKYVIWYELGVKHGKEHGENK